MKLNGLHMLILASAIAFWPASSFAKDEACTDGVDCLCDQLAGNGSIVLCEDFENPALDDGTGNGWVNEGYGGFADDHDCPDGPGSLDGDEGTDPDDCFNIVTEGACDVSNEGDCVFQGSQSLGAKYDNGKTHGHFGGKNIGPLSNFGITNVVKMSSNFQRGGGPGFKPTEWNSDTQAFHWGQDENSNWDAKSEASAGGSGPLDETTSDLAWNTKIFYQPDGPSPSVSGVDVRKGHIWQTRADVVSWSPYASDFPGGSQDWPLGSWGCLRTKWTGMGTSNASVQQWWQGPNDATETLIVDIRGLNTSVLPGLNAIRFNNYFNGPNQCGYGASNTFPCAYTGAPRAYRYEDNYVITNSDPLTCADIGFGEDSPGGGGNPGEPGPPAPPAAPILLPPS